MFSVLLKMASFFMSVPSQGERRSLAYYSLMTTTSKTWCSTSPLLSPLRYDGLPDLFYECDDAVDRPKMF